MLSNRLSILRMNLHSYGQRLKPSKSEPGIKWGLNEANRISIEQKFFGDLFALCQQSATNGRIVTLNVFGSGVRNDIRPQLKRALQGRSQKRIVDG